ncbi:MAG: aspartate aminotransferase family protein [Candidatus Sumerlaeaceae bacterium]
MQQARRLEELFFKHVGQTSPFPTKFPVARAEGCYLYDFEGRAYLDFIAGISVTNVGHGHPRVLEAVVEQARRYAHTMVYGEHLQQAQVELAAELTRLTPSGFDSVYFLTTGAEANDAALKLAAKATRRGVFCAFHGAYHGDTVGATSCFGRESFREPYAQILLPVRFLRYNCVGDLRLIDEQVAAVLVEPVQGEGGIVVPSREFLLALRYRCNEVGAFLIFDEVQTAFGRIGDAWFAANLFDVRPDVIVVAKALGAGYPLAAVIGPRELLYGFAAEPPFSHITTFGGHPVSCAAGLAGLQVMREERLLENSAKEGEFLLASLWDIASRQSAIRDVRGLGLMIGVELESPRLARSVVEESRRCGLLLETTLLAEQVIRMSPPLIVTREQCGFALEVFERALERAVRASSQ